jgi:hypothetical protein
LDIVHRYRVMCLAWIMLWWSLDEIAKGKRGELVMGSRKLQTYFLQRLSKPKGVVENSSVAGPHLFPPGSTYHVSVRRYSQQCTCLLMHPACSSAFSRDSRREPQHGSANLEPQNYPTYEPRVSNRDVERLEILNPATESGGSCRKFALRITPSSGKKQ